MEHSEIKLEEDGLCRLCGEMQKDVIQLSGEGREDIDTLIRCTLGYINMELVDDATLPNRLCAPCHLDAESTKKFLLMVEEAQRKLWQIRSRSNDDLESSGNVDGKHNEEPVDGIKDAGTSIESLSAPETSKKQLDNLVPKITEPMEAPIDTQMLAADNSASKYPKRMRKQRRRFSCDPLPYTNTEERVSDNDTGFGLAKINRSEVTLTRSKLLIVDSKCDNPGEASAGTLITIKPIAELCSENGASLAEMISVNTDKPQQATSNEPDIRLVCEYCKDVFNKESLFLKHLRNTHNETIYECAECEISYEKLKELQKHQRLTRHKGKTIRSKSKTITINESAQEKEQQVNSNNTTINVAIDNDGQITAMESDVKQTAMSEDKTSDQLQENYKTEQIEVTHRGLSWTKTVYKCLKCAKSYSSHYTVVRHHKEVHEGAREFKCQYCSESFTQGNTLAYHMSKHTGIRNYKCDKCLKAFVHKYELTLHIRTHTGEKPHVCEYCPKAFAHRSNLVVHMRLHSGQLPFKCETCGAHFNSSTHLKIHKQMHLRHAQKLVKQLLNKEEEATNSPTSNEILSQSANTVQDSIPATTSLLRPKDTIVKSVEILPPINAPPGPGATLNSSELKNILQNIPTETSTKPSAPLRYECTQCLQRFKLRSALTKHLRTHTGEKPYRCPLCPRTFADASNFKRHKSLHKSATEQLQNVSKQLKNSSFLNELQRDKTKSKILAVGSVSPTHSIASDPDPDGLEAIERTNAIMSATSISDLSDDDDADIMLDILDNVTEESLQQLSSASKALTSVSLHRPMVPKSPSQLVCISYPNPANPSDNKMTTFYL